MSSKYVQLQVIWWFEVFVTDAEGVTVLRAVLSLDQPVSSYWVVGQNFNMHYK